MKKLNGLLFCSLLGFATAVSGCQSAASDLPSKTGLSSESIPNLTIGLARMDGHTEPGAEQPYEAVLTELEKICTEDREDIALMAFTLAEKWEELGYQTSQLDSLKSLGSMAESIGDGRRIKCFDAYMQYRRSQKAEAEEIKADERFQSW